MIKLFAGILLATGILLMTGSGLCSLAVIIGSMPNGGGGIVWLALIIGGVPFSLGFGLFAWGRKLLRDQKRLSLDELNDRFE